MPVVDDIAMHAGWPRPAALHGHEPGGSKNLLVPVVMEAGADPLTD